MKDAIAILLLLLGFACLGLGAYTRWSQAPRTTPSPTPAQAASLRLRCVRAKNDITLFFRPVRRNAVVLHWQQLHYQAAIPAGHYGMAIEDNQLPTVTPDQTRSLTQVVWATEADPLLINVPKHRASAQWITANLLETADCNSIPAPTPKPVPATTVAAEVMPSAAPESAPPKQMNSVAALVTGVRFFESGMSRLPVDERSYTKQFASSQARYINWELALPYPYKDELENFVVTAVWYRPDQTVLVRQNIHCGPQWGERCSFHAGGGGGNVAGQWQSGDYRVDILIAGELVASNTFTVD